MRSLLPLSSLVCIPLLLSACATDGEPLRDETCDSCDSALPPLASRSLTLTTCHLAGSVLRCEEFVGDNVLQNSDAEQRDVSADIRIDVSGISSTPQESLSWQYDVDLAEHTWAQGSPIDVHIIGYVTFFDESLRRGSINFETTQRLFCEDGSCPSLADVEEGVEIAAPFEIWELGFASKTEDLKLVDFIMPEQDGDGSFEGRVLLQLGSGVDRVGVPVFDPSNGVQMRVDEELVLISSPGYWFAETDGFRPLQDSDLGL